MSTKWGQPQFDLRARAGDDQGRCRRETTRMPIETRVRTGRRSTCQWLPGDCSREAEEKPREVELQLAKCILSGHEPPMGLFDRPASRSGVPHRLEEARVEDGESSVGKCDSPCQDVLGQRGDPAILTMDTQDLERERGAHWLLRKVQDRVAESAIAQHLHQGQKRPAVAAWGDGTPATELEFRRAAGRFHRRRGSGRRSTQSRHPPA